MLILGSKSPRRRELLSKAGIDFTIVLKEVEEDISENDPNLYAMKTAEKKGLALLNDKELNKKYNFKDNRILCADTVVAISNQILGKPHNKEEARMMINKISGNVHDVITGVFLTKANSNSNRDYELFSVCTKVYVKKLTDKEIEEYISSDEPYDKAGGYGIQGLFGKYIDRIEGDYNNVVGLPLESVLKKLI